MIESILLAAARICTFRGGQRLTNASGFFFRRDDSLFLVTSRHVLHDAPSGHFPDRLEIELHTDAADFAQSTGFSIPLFRNGISQGVSFLFLNLIIVYGLDGCQLHVLALVGCQFGVFIFSSTHILTYHNLQRTGEVLLYVEDVLVAHSSERVVQIRRMHRRAVPCCGETRTDDALAL